MTSTSQLPGRRFGYATRVALSLTLLFFNVAITKAQSEPSLGEVARQTRAGGAEAKSEQQSAAAKKANELAAEIELGEENGPPPPPGFESYQANAYRVSVPSPFSVEGRDDNGVVLASADVTGITTRVFVADPLYLNSSPNDLEFLALVGDFWKKYGSLNCDRHRPGTPEYRCSVAGNIMGTPVLGKARFIRESDRIIPVVCFAVTIPLESLEWPQHPTLEARQRVQEKMVRNESRREAAQRSSGLCDTVLDSILPKRALSPSPASTPRVTTNSPSVQAATEMSSLGQVARAARQTAATSAKAKIRVDAEDTISQAPPGFRVRSATRCGTECWKETLFVPENARRVTGGESDNVYVATLDQETSVTFYFETVDSQNKYTEASAASIAYRWLHVQRDPRLQPFTMVHVVNGQQTPITRRRLLGAMGVAWTEEAIVLENDTAKSTLGCIAREDRFADVEWICSTVFDSWRISRK